MSKRAADARRYITRVEFLRDKLSEAQEDVVRIAKEQDAAMAKVKRLAEELEEAAREGAA